MGAGGLPRSALWETQMVWGGPGEDAGTQEAGQKSLGGVRPEPEGAGESQRGEQGRVWKASWWEGVCMLFSAGGREPSGRPPGRAAWAAGSRGSGVAVRARVVLAQAGGPGRGAEHAGLGWSQGRAPGLLMSGLSGTGAEASW